MMKRGQRALQSEKQLHLLDTTRSLFLKQGLLSVGMHEIAQGSGISKRTIYQLYDSRDALTAATILHDFEVWNEWFFDAVRERVRAGATMLAAFHEVLRLYSHGPDFYGCLFARVMLAPGMLSDTARNAAISCTEHLHNFFLDQLRKSRVPDKNSTARLQTVYTLLLLSGATRGLPGNFEKNLARDARKFVEETL